MTGYDTRKFEAESNQWTFKLSAFERIWHMIIQ